MVVTNEEGVTGSFIGKDRGGTRGCGTVVLHSSSPTALSAVVNVPNASFHNGAYQALVICTMRGPCHP